MERNVRVKEIGKRFVMWRHFVGQFPNDTNATRVFSFASSLRRKGRRRRLVDGVLHHLGAGLIRSSPMRNECEFMSSILMRICVSLMFLLCLAL